MPHDYLGWLACAISLTGNALATCYPRKVMMWGWFMFFIGNIIWIIYAVSLGTLPLMVYNGLRAIMSMRGVRNNTLKHIKKIKTHNKQ